MSKQFNGGILWGSWDDDAGAIAEFFVDDETGSVAMPIEDIISDALDHVWHTRDNDYNSRLVARVKEQVLNELSEWEAALANKT